MRAQEFVDGFGRGFFEVLEALGISRPLAALMFVTSVAFISAAVGSVASFLIH